MSCAIAAATRRAEAYLQFTALRAELKWFILENDNKMSKTIGLYAPASNFELADFTGKTIHLADYRGQKNVLLVFNRGFV